MRSVIVAFSDSAYARKISGILLMNGFPVRGVATNASMALRIVSFEGGGGLLICGSGFTDMSALQLLSLLPDDYDMLVLYQSGMIDLPLGHHEGLYTLQPPLYMQDLVSSARMLLDTRQLSYGSRHSARTGRGPAAESSAGKRRADEQKTIEKAKALLMSRNQMTEREAHSFLQKKSMDNGLKLIDMASFVLKGRNI